MYIIIESKKLLRASQAAAGHTDALRLFPRRPSEAATGFRPSGPHSSNHYRTGRRAAPVKGADAFFFTIKIRIDGSFPSSHALGA